MILSLYGNFLSPDGKAVDYEGIKLSPIFREYVDLASHLVTADITTLTADELKSFVINIYNALVVHGTVVLGNLIVYTSHPHQTGLSNEIHRHLCHSMTQYFMCSGILFCW
jgi:hypothetical protein